MKKRILSILLVLALCVSLLPAGVQAAVPTWDWAGYTPISSQAELAAISNDLDGKYYLTADITLSGSWTPIGTSSAPFTGVLDGNGYQISNLRWNATVFADSGAWGLFGYNDGVIRNLDMAGADLTPTVHKFSETNLKNCFIGVLAGVNNGQIENCHVLSSSRIMATASSHLTVGGICGGNNGTVRHCSNAMTIKINTQYTALPSGNPHNIRIGGIVGSQEGYSAKTDYCTNSGWIYTDGSGTDGGTGGHIGGIAGEAIFSPITNCRNTGAIYAEQVAGANTTQYVGGIVGVSNYIVSRCENTADGDLSIYGSDIYAGGIVGNLGNYIGGTVGNIGISQCRNDGDITLNARKGDVNSFYGYAGSIVGSALGAKITCCYNDNGALYANAGTTSSGTTVKFAALDLGYIGGELYSCELSQCYNPVLTTSSSLNSAATSWRLGGLIGWAEDCTVGSSSYYNLGNTRGAVGYDDGSNTIDAVGVAQKSYFNQQRNYPNFDFDTVWTLSGLRAIFTDPLTHTHSLVKTAGTEGTCTTAGSTDYWYCAGCDTYFRDSGAAYVISKADAAVYGTHVAGTAVRENEVAATCTNAGSYDEVVYCSICKTHEMSRTAKTTGKLDHDYGVPEFRWAEDYGSCTAVFTCKYGCGIGEEKSCTVTVKNVEGDCQTAGRVVYTAVCGTYSDSKTVTGQTGSHKAGTPVRENITPATCKTGGSYDEVTYCTVCGDEMSRVEKTLPQTAHNPGEAVRENEVASTCEVAGSYDEVTYCTACGDELSREEKQQPLAGHTPGETVTENVTAATCEEEGSYEEVVYCDVCEAELSRETKTTDKTGHTPGEPVEEDRVEPACNAHGEYYEVTYCTVCDAQLSRQWKGLEMLPHTPDAFEIGERMASTCTTEGWYEQLTLCSVCRNLLDTEIITLPLAEHDPDEAVRENETASTCEVAGSYDEVTYCGECGDELTRVEKTLPLAAHTPGEWIVDRKPTSLHTGWQHKECTACGTEVESEEIPVLPALPFTDVAPGAFYYDAVDWAYHNDITRGTGGTLFSPGAVCTRAETVTFLWRAMGKPEPTTTVTGFTDVAPGAFYEKAVAWAVENGITSGTSAKTFSPNAKVTRSQVVTFLWRCEQQPAVGGENPFRDVSANAFYYHAVLWAVDEGITQGVGTGKFAPDVTCTRGEIVTFLYRYVN